MTQASVERLARMPRLLILAGHYEGIDERVIERSARRRSRSATTCSGGEIAAMVLIDTVVRLLPGALEMPSPPGATVSGFGRWQVVSPEGAQAAGLPALTPGRGMAGPHRA